jgi:hypothetical protein
MGAIACPAFCPLGRHDQLQQFLGIVEDIIGLFSIHAKRARSQLPRNGGLGNRWIRRDEADFIYVDMLIAFKRRLQLLGQLCGFRASSGRKAACKLGQACRSDRRRKVDARDACGWKHPCKSFFRRRRFERRAV